MVADFSALLGWRAASGFFLAGIYPMGMKIASQWFPKGLGAALGLPVGALVLGSASPHALRALSTSLPWHSVMLGVAALAALGASACFWACPNRPRTLAPTPTPSANPVRSSGARWG